jgi:hypothetical protein
MGAFIISRPYADWSKSECRKYTVISRAEKAGQNRATKIANRSFEKVAKFGYLGLTLTSRNYMYKETKSR